MEMLSRLRSAMRIVLKGEGQRRRQAEVPAITPEEVAEIKTFFPREKFFIFGHARSGTTLLMRLVRLHPEVHCNYQAHFFTRRPLLKSLVDTPEAEEWLTRKSNRWNHGRDLSPLVLRATADFIMEREAAKAGKVIVGDKSPVSVIHGQAVRDLHAVYPDAKLVYLVRDGRDVLISERFRNFVEQSRFLSARDKRILDDLRQDAAPFTNGSRSIFTEAFIRRVATSWATDLREIEQEAKRLFGRNYYSLRYEDVLAGSMGELSRLWRFLGVKRISRSLESAVKRELSSNPDQEWQAKRNEDIAPLLPKGKSRNWERFFGAEDKATFKEAAGEMLVAWEYEKTPNW
jgi:hypothetical protein